MSNKYLSARKLGCIWARQTLPPKSPYSSDRKPDFFPGSTRERFMPPSPSVLLYEAIYLCVVGSPVLVHLCDDDGQTIR